MKTLQEWLRSFNAETVYQSRAEESVPEEFCAFYNKLASMPDVKPNHNRVLFAASYYGWTPGEENRDFAASGYDVNTEAVFGILFTPREEALGYLVSDVSTEMFGGPRVLMSILDEMSFYGRYGDEAIQTMTELPPPSPDALDDIEDDEGFFAGLDIEENEEDLAYQKEILERNYAIRAAQLAAIRALLKQ